MILELSSLLSSAVEKTLEDNVAISFSGGLDSTLIATIAKKHANVDLYAAGALGSPDLEYAEKAAEELGLPLHKIIIDEKLAMETYEKTYKVLPLDFLKVEILVPVYLIAKAAKEAGHSVLLFGSGAEELFVGYERYYDYVEEGKDLDKILKDEFKTLPKRDIGWIKKICRNQGIEARCPFCNADVATLLFSVPLEERMADRELKKGILREAGKILGVPKLALLRRKKAMQYGSGVHKIFMKKVDEINAHFPAVI
ncbi:MAG: asparagine synthase C-terminal domain-containing protein [Candidatus Micrarchaeota archaeon]|nr:asparagine synthase C-terminal domain-containing protein [Candidatus Micrarchaeota archaeon]MBU1682097.1 asparagine synthase C-terminal domain-containing protein [Candidatus Micrarchaeota archaeon]